MAELGLDGLAVRYGERAVLSGLSARVPAGQHVALIGPNGSGKTTLLRALCGIVAPSAGRALLDGRPVLSLPRAALARSIAFLPQEEHWEFPFTVEEVVRCGRFAHTTALYRESVKDRVAVERALDAVGL
ncbi:MAG: ABC transporter ATP-binding protein, partial [Planctomycetota bacterium]